MGQHRQEAVHFAVDLEFGDNPAAVGLEAAVEIVEADAGEQSGHRVEHAGGEGLGDGIPPRVLPAAGEVVPFG